MIMLYASALLAAIISADPKCRPGAQLVIRVYPEYAYRCVYPEQLHDPIWSHVPPEALRLYPEPQEETK